MKKPFYSKFLRKSFRKLVSWLEVPESKVKAKMAEDRLEQSLALWLKGKRFCLRASVPEVAQELGTTQEALSRYVQRHFGENFCRWRTRLRITEACRLMAEHPEKSLGDIRNSVGIPDKSNFRLHFREICGCTPAQWLSEKKLQVSGDDR